jgi:hypothetical protein
MLWAANFPSLIHHQSSKEPTQDKSVMMEQLPLLLCNQVMNLIHSLTQSLHLDIVYSNKNGGS